MTIRNSVSRRTVLKGIAAGTIGTGLAGCTSDENTSSSQSQELQVWAFGPHAPIAEKIAEQWDSTHSPTVQSVEGINEKLTNALQSGSNLPSITLVTQTFYINGTRKGAFENINAFMEENADTFFTAAKSLNQVDGEWYGIPNDLGPVVMVYNADLFKSAGLPTNPSDAESEIETWSDWMNAAEAVESETGAKMGAFNTNSPHMNFYSATLLPEYGGRYYDENGKFNFAMQQNVNAYTKLKELQQYVLDGAVTWKGEAQSAFKNGKYAIALAPAWAMGATIPEVFSEMSSLRVMRPPMAEDGLGVRTGNWGGAPSAIPAQLPDEEKAAALEFGEFWHLSEAGFNEKISGGMFPGTDRPDAEVVNQGVQFYGGEKVWQKAMQSARDLPPIFNLPNQEVRNMLSRAQQEIFDEGAPIQETLTKYNERMIGTITETDKEVDRSQYE